MTSFSSNQAGSLPKANDVLYMPGWSYCYRLISAPFCRIHYLRCQGHLVAAPSDSPDHVAYLMQPLGGDRVDHLLLRTF
ncbi:MAG TPA: hypothetical protein V6D07_15865 [Trichocoleus sp.]